MDGPVFDGERLLEVYILVLDGLSLTLLAYENKCVFEGGIDGEGATFNISEAEGDDLLDKGRDQNVALRVAFQHFVFEAFLDARVRADYHDVDLKIY